ncbi:hypothetical protein P3C58_08705 [Mesorhizobium sp. XAP10]|uniref:hypothetical protein n=1 Tax=unclassified Mesorhizobium TaxID=325217 RepID=UPI0023DFBE29|nr:MULTISPECIES: hypothetical protein [unclassified Mesorhizobium]MDF3152055.1 hypothetical protein [Mesorhizobium sp. XAP10]MDF3244941.1 hypothetical protein [Mesorhizobium sp. XAP4]
MAKKTDKEAIRFMDASFDILMLDFGMWQEPKRVVIEKIKGTLYEDFNGGEGPARQAVRAMAARKGSTSVEVGVHWLAEQIYRFQDRNDWRWRGHLLNS